MSSFRWFQECLEGSVCRQLKPWGRKWAGGTIQSTTGVLQAWVTSSWHFKGELSTLIKGRCVSIYAGNPNTHILGQDSIKEGNQSRSGSRDLGGGHSNWLTQPASTTQDHLLGGGTARRELGSSISVVNQENTPRDLATGWSERWV